MLGQISLRALSEEFNINK